MKATSAGDPSHHVDQEGEIGVYRGMFQGSENSRSKMRNSGGEMPREPTATSALPGRQPANIQGGGNSAKGGEYTMPCSAKHPICSFALNSKWQRPCTWIEGTIEGIERIR